LIDGLILFDDGYGMRPEEPTVAAIAEAERVAVKAFGPQSLQVAMVRIRLASTMTNYGNFEGSEQNFLAAIPVLESQLGPDHSSTLSALNNLGYLYHRRNDIAAAERLHRDLLARQISKQGLVHESVGDSYQNLAGAITHQGRFEESIPLHRKAYEIFGSVMNEDNYKIALPLLSIAYAELQLTNAIAAEEAAREALGRFESTAPGTVLEGVALCLVGLALEQQGQVSEGSDLVLRSHPLLGTSRAPEPYPKLCRLAD
jgi:tetratricopeptide (TPR) repeat protein